MRTFSLYSKGSDSEDSGRDLEIAFLTSAPGEFYAWAAAHFEKCDSGH
jgi:hypothetical protein